MYPFFRSGLLALIRNSSRICVDRRIVGCQLQLSALKWLFSGSCRARAVFTLIFYQNFCTEDKEVSCRWKTNCCFMSWRRCETWGWTKVVNHNACQEKLKLRLENSHILLKYFAITGIYWLNIYCYFSAVVVCMNVFGKSRYASRVLSF